MDLFCLRFPASGVQMKWGWKQFQFWLLCVSESFDVMAAEVASVYSSEYEVIRQSAAGAESSHRGRLLSWDNGAKGSLYGLWTHSGNVLIQLANPANDRKEASWNSFCKEQKLKRVGLWGTEEPRISDRPSVLDASVGFIYIRCSASDRSLVCYSIPASGVGYHGHRQSSIRTIELSLLPAASPYRSVRDPEGTSKVMSSVRQSGLLMQKPVSSLIGHWIEKAEYVDFLRDLCQGFSDKGIDVKQYQPPGSDIIALQIKEESSGFSGAVAFPPDFDKKRQVQVYRGQGGRPDVTVLPQSATHAIGALLGIFDRRQN